MSTRGGKMYLKGMALRGNSLRNRARLANCPVMVTPPTNATEYTSMAATLRLSPGWTRNRRAATCCRRVR
jgi:hypothetical protein